MQNKLDSATTTTKKPRQLAVITLKSFNCSPPFIPFIALKQTEGRRGDVCDDL